MSRQSYNELLDNLRDAQQYINILIKDDTYGIVNQRAYKYEYARIKSDAKFLAVVQVEPSHDVDQVRRALHVRHPGVLLLAQPRPQHFACHLSHDPESWCVRVKSSLRKHSVDCTVAWINAFGNPALDFLACLELIELATPKRAV
jgi:hypothetical protein